jgi:hypothetical protein
MAEKEPIMPPQEDKGEKKPDDQVKPKEFYRTKPDGTVEFIDNPGTVPERDFNAEK